MVETAEEKKQRKTVYMREWRKANRETIRAYEKAYYHGNRANRKTKMKDKSLQRLYGISLEEFNNTLSKQSNKCANKGCGVDYSKGHGWVWDHDHKTGKGRGILCSNCNLALGLVGDSIDRLYGLMEYLHASTACE